MSHQRTIMLEMELLVREMSYLISFLFQTVISQNCICNLSNQILKIVVAVTNSFIFVCHINSSIFCKPIHVIFQLSILEGASKEAQSLSLFAYLPICQLGLFFGVPSTLGRWILDIHKAIFKNVFYYEPMKGNPSPPPLQAMPIWKQHISKRGFPKGRVPIIKMEI